MIICLTLWLPYRSSEQESTGFSPNFLMFRRETNMPLELMFGLTSDVSEPLSIYAASLREKFDNTYKSVIINLKQAASKQKHLYEYKHTLNGSSRTI